MSPKLTSYRQYRSRYGKRLKTLSQRPVAQASLVLIFSLLTVSFFGIFAIKPTLVTIAELMRSIRDKEEVNIQLQNKIEALALAQANYEKIKPYLEDVEKIIPQEVSFLHLLSEINLIAWEKQVVLEGGRFGEFVLVRTEEGLVIKEEEQEATASATKTPLSELTFSLNLSGDYQNLKKFLGELAKIDRLIIMEETIFQTEGTEEVSLLVDIQAKAFYLEKTSIYSKNGEEKI